MEDNWILEKKEIENKPGLPLQTGSEEATTLAIFPSCNSVTVRERENTDLTNIG